MSRTELAALRFIVALHPTGRDRTSHQTARYLDGLPSEMDSMPAIRAKLDYAIATLSSSDSRANR